MKHLRIILLQMMILSVCAPLFSQENEIIFEQPAEEIKKNYPVALSGIVVPNILIFCYNRYIAKADYAMITKDDIKFPWNHKPEFDHDWWEANYIQHPVQGAIPYLIARNCNLNMFESFLCAAASSAIWEFAGEVDEPAINDLYFTPVGGFILGEVLYKLSLEAQHKGHTFLSFCANPCRIYTAPFVKNKPVGPGGLLHDLSFFVGYGVCTQKAFLNPDAELTNKPWIKALKNHSEFIPCIPFAGIDAVYNDPYGHDTYSFFSQFEFEFQGGPTVDDNSKVDYFMSILVNGDMYARSLDFGETRDTTFGLFLDYDYVKHPLMEFATLGPAVAFKQRINGSKVDFEWQTHGEWAVLGGSDSYYITHKHVHATGLYRDYEFTTGGEFQGKAALKFKNGMKIAFDTRAYALYKFEFQKQEKYDDTGWSFISFSRLFFEIPVTKVFTIGVSDMVYAKAERLFHDPDYSILNNTVNVYARFYTLR